MEVVLIEIRMLMVVINLEISVSVCCTAAVTLKSMIGGDWCKVLISIRDNTSATHLSVPLTCQMSYVNCEMYSRCLNCLGMYLL